MLTVEDGWLAGMIESEGCIDLKRASGKNKAHRLRMRLKMVDEDVVARVARAWGSTYRHRPYGKHNPNWQDQFETEILGRRAELICERLMPLFGERRQAKIKECLAQVDRKYDAKLRS